VGDLSRLPLLEELDLELVGLLCEERGTPSVAGLEYELDLEFPGFFCEIRGSSVGVSEVPSDGRLSTSGEKTLRSIALGGSFGRDLSNNIVLFEAGSRCLWRLAPCFVAVFFLRLCINDS